MLSSLTLLLTEPHPMRSLLPTVSVFVPKVKTLLKFPHRHTQNLPGDSKSSQVGIKTQAGPGHLAFSCQSCLWGPAPLSGGGRLKRSWEAFLGEWHGNGEWEDCPGGTEHSFWNLVH